MPLDPELDTRPGPPGAAMTRLGTLLGAASLAALAASVPAAGRVARDADGRFGVTGTWLALAAAAAVPMILAVAVLRGARRGAASFGGDGATPRALGLAIWLLATTLALLVFGAALRATTHHHALAGATFAALGVAAALGLGAASSRLVAIVSAFSPLAQRAALGLVAAALLAALLALSFKVGRIAPAAVSLLVDVLAAFIAAGLLSGPALARSRVLAALGPPLAVALLVLGLGVLRTTPKLPAATRTRAPLLAWPVECTAQLVRKR